MGEMVRAAVLGPARDPVAPGILLQRALGRQQLPVIGAATVRDPAPEPAGGAGQLGGARASQQRAAVGCVRTGRVWADTRPRTRLVPCLRSSQIVTFPRT